MATNKEMATFILDSKLAIGNKLLQDDGTITNIAGRAVINPVQAYEAKPALPNKFLNPDGTYSTLNEIFAEAVDTSIFVIVDELPEVGNEDKIYLVPDGKGGFVEYHYRNGKWDPIGMIDIDLSNYPTVKEVSDAIEASALQVLTAAQEYAKNYTDEQIKQIPVIDATKFLDKTASGKNVLAGSLQVGDHTKDIANAYLHMRKVTAPITGKNVNGASFGVNADGTAAFFQKTYNNDGTGAKNAAVLRFSGKGLQFAVNTGSASSPTDEMYKEIATQEYVQEAIKNIVSDKLGGDY